MSTIQTAPGSTLGRKMIPLVVAAVASIALVLSGSVAAQAATGLTGEYDIIYLANNGSGNPVIRTYDHSTGNTINTVANGDWFAVGSGRFIDRRDPNPSATPPFLSTPVYGGGIRVDSSLSAGSYRLDVVSVVRVGAAGTQNLSIYSPTSGVPTWNYTGSSISKTVSAGLHEHYDWTFPTTSGTYKVLLRVYNTAGNVLYDSQTLTFTI